MFTNPYVRAAAFVVLVCGLGLSLSLFVEHEVIRIVVFGTIVVVVGLSVAGFKIIDKLAADRMYYTFAVVGICIFFASEVPKRQREQLQVEYLRNQNELEKGTQDLAVIGFIAERPEVLLSEIREGIKRTHSELSEFVYGCRDVFANPPLGEPTGPLAKAQDHCARAKRMPENCDWSVADELFSLRDVEKNRPRLKPIASFNIKLLETDLPWYELAKLLFGESEKIDVESRRGVLLVNKQGLEDALSIDIDAQVFQEEVKGARFRKFLSEFWPVLLITLVGLKLSRG